MSRSISLRMASALAAGALLLGGCSGASEPAAPEAEGEAPAATEEGTAGEGGLIAVITPSHDNPFFKAEADAAVAQAEELGYETTSASHDDDPNKQSQLIDSAIQADAAAIILDNAGADASIGPVRKAVDAGIPVFLIDREINETGLATAQIVSNNAQCAQIVAEAFANALGGAGRYVELVGKESDTNAGVRSSSYANVLSQYPDLEQVAQETANWDQQEAFTKTETILQSNPDITGIIAGNDTMALGAVAAVEAAGLTEQITIAGLDGSPDAVQAIKDGTLLATALQPAVQIAEMAVEQADEVLTTGEASQPEKQSVNCELVTAENADSYTSFALE